ncbi:MAG: phosphate butyryltransferase [Lachnospiraceae bacterium]|nr:phosphate butyryltransferase [Lachnospiraceae bacterium]
MGKHFEKIINQVKSVPLKKLSVAAANDSNVLEAVKAAKERGIAEAILVGDPDKMGEIAKELNMNLSDYEVIAESDPIAAATKAVKLVHDGEADMYMKGLISSKDFLKSVLDKEVGLITGKPLSHTCLFEIEGVEQLLFLSDVAFMTYPTLEDKVHIIENTVAVANACGINNPKVAALAAVEVVNPKMECTVEAGELSKMQDEGKITGCIVDGPLSLDMAISREACEHKGALDRKVVGDADILLFPDIHAGNIAYKFIVHTTKFENGCILTGTKAPAILTSRSDSTETKVNSIALAAVVAEHLKNK